MITLVLSAMVGVLCTKIFDSIQRKRREHIGVYVITFILLVVFSMLYAFLGTLEEPPQFYSKLVTFIEAFESNTSLQIFLVAVSFIAIFIVDARTESVLSFSRYSKVIREFTGEVREGGQISIAAGDMDFLGGVGINGTQVHNLMDNSAEYVQLLNLRKNFIKLKILCRHGLEDDLLNAIIHRTTSPEIVYAKYRNMGSLGDSSFQQLLRIGRIKTDFKSAVDIRFYNSEIEDKQFRGRFIDGAGIVYRKELEHTSLKFEKKKTFPFFHISNKKEDLYSVNKLNKQELQYYNDMFLLKWQACDKDQSQKLISFCESLYHYVNNNQPRFHMALVYVNSYEVARKKERRKEFPPFGVMYLASAVRQESDWDVKLIAVDKNTPAENLDWSEYDAIGFSIISSYSYDILKRSYNLCQKKVDAVIFAGGYQAEKFSSNVFTDFKAHIVFKGEGENSIRSFCQHYENRNFSEIPGVIYRGSDQNIHATNGPRCVDINAIEPPARDLIPVQDLVMTDRLAETELRMVHMLFSRGCVYNCYYCAANQDNQIRKIRYRDKDKICLELTDLIETFHIQGFSVIDDCFLTDKEKAIEICDYIASKNLGLQWSLAARVDSIDDEVLSSLKKSGCIEIKFGVETGSDELLKKMNKCETVADAEAAIKKTNSYGIGVKLFIITGLPFETDATHQETKDFLSKMQPYISRVSLLRYTPLAGSYIYSQPEKFGIKKSTLTRDNFNKTSLYRRSFDWWKDNMRYKDCERWYKDMSKFIEDRWGDA